MKTYYSIKSSKTYIGEKQCLNNENKGYQTGNQLKMLLVHCFVPRSNYLLRTRTVPASTSIERMSILKVCDPINSLVPPLHPIKV